MSAFIDQLRNEHVEILATLAAIQRLGPGHGECAPLLIRLEEQIIDHLTKEDERLYPPLAKSADRDETLAIMLDHFTDDIKRVTVRATEFFLNHEREKDHAVQAEEFDQLAQRLRQRMEVEEKVLYRKFEALVP